MTAPAPLPEPVQKGQPRTASTVPNPTSAEVPDDSTAGVGEHSHDRVDELRKPPSGPPDSPPPTDPVASDENDAIRGLVSVAFARRLDEVANEARKASRRTWGAFLILVVVAAAAVATAVVIHDKAISTAAATVLVAAGLVATARAADVLGASATAIAFLRKQTKVANGEGSGEATTGDHRPPRPYVEAAALEVARRLQGETKLAEAKSAFELAAEHGRDPEAPLALAGISFDERDFDQVVHWLKEATDRGSTEAAYRLGRLDPDETLGLPNEHVRFVKHAARTHPSRADYWQAYYAALRSTSGRRAARTAMIEEFFDHPDNPILHLLTIRASCPTYADVLSDIDESRYRDTLREYLFSRSSDTTLTHADIIMDFDEHAAKFPFVQHILDDEDDAYRPQFPRSMHPELYFHAAVQLIHGDRSARDFQRRLREALIGALRFDSAAAPPWLWQIFVILTADILFHTSEADELSRSAELLQSVLATKPPINGPLSTEDIQSLVVILKSVGRNDAEALIAEVVRARPNLQGAGATHAYYRQSVATKLVQSMVPGVEFGALVPDTSALTGADLSALIPPREPPTVIEW